MPPPPQDQDHSALLACGHHLLNLAAQSFPRSQGREGCGSQPPRPHRLSPRLSSRSRGCPRNEHTWGPAGRGMGPGNSYMAWAAPLLPEQVPSLRRHPHPKVSPPGNTEDSSRPGLELQACAGGQIS